MRSMATERADVAAFLLCDGSILVKRHLAIARIFAGPASGRGDVFRRSCGVLSVYIFCDELRRVRHDSVNVGMRWEFELDTYPFIYGELRSPNNLL